MGAALAFDTSGPVGSVAVGAADGTVLASGVLPVRQEHASRLLPTIAEVLGEAGVVPEGITTILVGDGPGSFTGVRVSAATAKGLAATIGKPLRPVSSLLAAAWSTVPVEVRQRVVTTGGRDSPVRTEVRYVLFDARGDRVYGACYRFDGADLCVVHPVHAGRIGEVLERVLPEGTVFVGEGSARHRPLLESRGCRVDSGAGTEALAIGLLRAMRSDTPPDPVELASWEPRYVRASSAERLWNV